MVHQTKIGGVRKKLIKTVTHYTMYRFVSIFSLSSFSSRFFSFHTTMAMCTMPLPQAPRLPPRSHTLAPRRSCRAAATDLQWPGSWGPCQPARRLHAPRPWWQRVPPACTSGEVTPLPASASGEATMCLPVVSEVARPPSSVRPRAGGGRAPACVRPCLFF